jgi:hypothetical protein
MESEDMMARKKYRYQWYEGASEFYIVDTKTGKEAVMGDGVDMFSHPNSFRSIPVGTKAFYKAMNDMFLNDQATLGEAYFGQYE